MGGEGFLAVGDDDEKHLLTFRIIMIGRSYFCSPYFACRAPRSTSSFLLDRRDAPCSDLQQGWVSGFSKCFKRHSPVRIKFPFSPHTIRAENKHFPHNGPPSSRAIHSQNRISCTINNMNTRLFLDISFFFGSLISIVRKVPRSTLRVRLECEIHHKLFCLSTWRYFTVHSLSFSDRK